MTPRIGRDLRIEGTNFVACSGGDARISVTVPVFYDRERKLAESGRLATGFRLERDRPVVVLYGLGPRANKQGPVLATVDRGPRLVLATKDSVPRLHVAASTPSRYPYCTVNFVGGAPDPPYARLTRLLSRGRPETRAHPSILKGVQFWLFESF